MKKTKSDNDVYGSGLNDRDWDALRNVFYPFVHAKNPQKITIFKRTFPWHLRNHPIISHLKKYRETGRKHYLDKAGHLLIPQSPKEKFGWYQIIAMLGGPLK